jgi:hypothetical protein
MFKGILATSCAILVFTAASAVSAETLNQTFCRKEHPGDYNACLQYEEKQDHKLFTGDTGQAGPSAGSSETIPYDPANEARKRRSFKPVPGSIIMDSSPAKEIPMK